jgi:plastocyanin
MTRAIRTAAIVVLATSALAACGGDGGDGRGGRGDDATTVTPAVRIEDFAFSPDALRVRAGTTVTFTNGDEFEHSVTAKDGSFDSGHLAEGAAFERTFGAAGTYPYLCSIHNSMTGSVVVS